MIRRKKRKKMPSRRKRGAKKMSIADYRQNLDERYGNEFTGDLDAVFTGQITLAQISRKYGETKSRLSQIFRRVYGTSFRQSKENGGSKDQDGTIFSFEHKNSKKFMVALPDALHEKLRAYSSDVGLSMSVVIRDCIADLFVNDGLGTLSKLF